MPKIAISYRRTDSDITGRIFDRVVERYGRDSVFRDIDSIPVGMDFRKAVNDALQDADALIAIVGPNWSGGQGQESSRINEDNDLVRIEIETALQSGIPIIPALVGGARMPQAAVLPESLRDFSFRNAAIIDSGRNFDTDVQRLLRSMDRMLNDELTHPGIEPSPERCPGRPNSQAQSPSGLPAQTTVDRQLSAESFAGKTRSRHVLIATFVGTLILCSLAVYRFYIITPTHRSVSFDTKIFNYPMYVGFRLDFCYRSTVLCGKEAAIRFCNANNYRTVADDNGFAIDPNVWNTISPGDNQVGGRDGFKFIKCVGPIK